MISTPACRCLLCFFPAANSITGAVAGALVAALLWHSTQRMIGKVINRRLKLRLRLFQLIFLAGTAPGVAVLCVIVFVSFQSRVGAFLKISFSGLDRHTLWLALV